jgi:putative transposase
MTRRRSLHVTRRDQELLPRLQALQALPPCWGYRRVWACLRCVEHLPVNRKRMWRLMREPHRFVPPHLRLKAKRTPMGSTPKPTKPDEGWGIDMTKVLVQGFGWVSIVVIPDWYTTTRVGYDVGVQCRAKHWLAALAMAVHGQFPEGARGQGVPLMSDNGCQPTSLACMEACGTLGMHQAFTSDNNPKGHADTERVIRTLTEACLWLRDGTCPFALLQALEAWVADDNEHSLHAPLGYKPPAPFEREYSRSPGPPFLAA